VDAEFNHLAGTFHEYVEVLRLGVATTQAGHCGYVVTFFVAFDNDCEFPLRLQECAHRGDSSTESEAQRQQALLQIRSVGVVVEGESQSEILTAEFTRQRWEGI
jgi:hypothetical protein